jgi:hypothetical protein
MAYELLMVSTADDYVVHPGKSCVAVSDGPLHVPLDSEGWPRISKAKRHPLVLEQAEGGGEMAVYSASLSILWVDT